jgi:hypothetical protein
MSRSVPGLPHSRDVKAAGAGADIRSSHGFHWHTRHLALIVFVFGRISKMRRVLALVLVVLLSFQSLRVAAAPYCNLTLDEHAVGIEQEHNHAPASAADVDVDSDEEADNATRRNSHAQLYDACCAHVMAALLISQVQPSAVSIGVVFDMPRLVNVLTSPASVRPERPQWHMTRTSL